MNRQVNEHVFLTTIQLLCCIQSNRMHNPANQFPVFRNQDAIDKEEWIKDATGEMTRRAARGGPGYSQANTVRHYDNTTERRARGVGFYAFSQDEEERARQMRELLEMRNQVRMTWMRCRGLMGLWACLVVLRLLITYFVFVPWMIDGDVEVKAQDTKGQTAGRDRGTQGLDPTEAAKVSSQHRRLLAQRLRNNKKSVNSNERNDKGEIGIWMCKVLHGIYLQWRDKSSTAVSGRKLQPQKRRTKKKRRRGIPSYA